MRACTSCGDTHAFEVVAPGDLERTYDFDVEWRGLRFLCPACGAVQRVSFAPVELTNTPLPGQPANLRVQARIRTGPEIVPFRRPGQNEPDTPR